MIMVIFLKNSLRSARTVAGILAIPIVLILSELGQILSTLTEKGYEMTGGIWTAAVHCFMGKAMLLSLPIVCTLAGSAAFLEDIKSHYIRAILMRTGRRRYLWARIMASGLAGGIAIAAGMLLTLGVLTCFPLFVTIPEAPASDMVFLRHLGGQLLQLLVLYFLAAVLWASVGMLASAMTNSLLVAYLAPFIVFYLLQILYERYLPRMKLIDPRQWVQPEAGWPGGPFGAGLLMTELLMLVMLTFVCIAERKSLLEY